MLCVSAFSSWRQEFQRVSPAAVWRKTMVPARPKNPGTPQTTCKTDFCNKIGHEPTLSMNDFCQLQA
jgi:hypothetical protein